VELPCGLPVSGHGAYHVGMTDSTHEHGFNPSGDYNSTPRPRPRFDLHSDVAPGDLLTHFQQSIQASPHIGGLVVPENGTVEMTLVDVHVRIWSPQLSLLITEKGSGAAIKARFGPHPNVWGLFLAGYAISGMLACGLLLFGCVQAFLDQTPWALYASPIALLGVALVYGAAYVGQGLGAGQMHDLRQFLGQTLESAGLKGG
jgi:hypothetical protein